MSYDYYIIHSRSLSEAAILYTEFLEDQGYTCYLPCRDLDDDRLPLDIYQGEGGILNAIAQSRRAVMIWDGVSQMSLVDLGAALMIGLHIDYVQLHYKGQAHSLVNQLRENARRE